jgi:hypothetical protein
MKYTVEMGSDAVIYSIDIFSGIQNLRGVHIQNYRHTYKQRAR